MWTQSNIRLLLEEYDKRKDKFRNPSIKKKLLWSEIKDEFVKHNYIVTNDILDKKFRNLKKTYLKIHDNNKKTSTGKGTVTWEYYNVFCNIFDKDKTVSMDHALSSMRVMTENDETLNPEVLDLPPIDLTNRPNTCDISVDEDNPVPSTSTIESAITETTKNSKRAVKRNYNVFRKDVLDMEREKLQETKRIRESIDKMVIVQEQRNKILAELSDYLKKTDNN